MGVLDTIASYFTAYAEEPAEEPQEEQDAAEDSKADGETAEKEESDDAEEAEEEEEDEEDDEPVDPREEIEKGCTESAACKHHKHEYDDCVARVTDQIESDGAAKEDCVEEFFHLTHCVQACVAPKLFKALK